MDREFLFLVTATVVWNSKTIFRRKERIASGTGIDARAALLPDVLVLRSFALRSLFLPWKRLRNGKQDFRKRFQSGKLRFFHNVMWLCSGIRRALFAHVLKPLAGGKYLHVQKIIADEGHYFAVGIKSIFAEHRTGREPLWIAEFRQEEFDGFFLCGHVASLSFNRQNP